jgi:hypothetical protein
VSKRKPVANANDNVLDLDELFGVDQPLRVKLGEDLFDLLPLTAFGPAQLLQLQQLQRELGKLRGSADDATTARALAQVVDKIIELICPDLSARELTFARKLSVLNFYNQKTAPAGKKTQLTNLRKKRTGDARSPA